MKEIELDSREKCCCFTGHRPEKMEEIDMLGYDIACEVYKAMNAGFTTFITGGAKGMDIIAAEAVLLMRERVNGLLKLVVALPYPTFGQRWTDEWKWRFERMIRRADKVISISAKCTYSAYRQRNEWMVDHSSLVLAVYSGAKGGTRNTLKYAEKTGIPTRICADINSTGHTAVPDMVDHIIRRVPEPWEE